MFGGREIASMKPAAYLINTARAASSTKAALKAALIDGQLARRRRSMSLRRAAGRSRVCCRCRAFSRRRNIGGTTEEAVLAMGRAAIAGLDASPESIDLTA